MHRSESIIRDLQFYFGYSYKQAKMLYNSYAKSSNLDYIEDLVMDRKEKIKNE